MKDDKFVGDKEDALAILKLLDPSVTSLDDDDDDSEIVGVATGEDI